MPKKMRHIKKAKKLSREMILLIGGLFLGVLSWTLHSLLVDVLSNLLDKIGIVGEISQQLIIFGVIFILLLTIFGFSWRKIKRGLA